MFKIDKEFKNILPPLRNEEYRLLEENILRYGCKNALVTWRGILLDGHHRYKICKKHNILFKTIEIELEDREKLLSGL